MQHPARIAGSRGFHHHPSRSQRRVENWTFSHTLSHRDYEDDEASADYKETEGQAAVEEEEKKTSSSPASILKPTIEDSLNREHQLPSVSHMNNQEGTRTQAHQTTNQTDTVSSSAAPARKRISYNALPSPASLSTTILVVHHLDMDITTMKATSSTNETHALGSSDGNNIHDGDRSPVKAQSCDLYGSVNMSSLSSIPSSSSLPLSSPFDESEDVLLWFSFINNYIEPDDPLAARLTLQQASVLRYRVSQHDADILSLLQQHQETLDQCRSRCNTGIDGADDLLMLESSFCSRMAAKVADLVAVEAECHLCQSNELEVLHAIFADDELSISFTCPIVVKMAVKLEDIDCEVELVFLLPAHYPRYDALIVNSYIPPPFDAFYSSETHENSLQSALVSVAQTLIGDDAGSIYSCIERARSWISSQLHYLQISLERLTAERAEKQAKCLLFDAFNEGEQQAGNSEIGLFGRGRVEFLMNEAVSSTALQRNITRAQAKALLKEQRWRIISETTNQETPNDNRCDSSSLHADQSSVFAHLCSSSSSLTCLSCLESFQWREGAMMRCGHFLCYSCYARYLVSHLNDGQAYIRDPGHKCPYYVDENLIFSLLSTAGYVKYRRFLQDSFITLRGWRYCVGNNGRCDYVVNSHHPYGSVLCFCGASFCFSCGKSPGHWPLVCGETASYFNSQVIRELRQQYETNQRLDEDEAVIVQTKPCPKCKSLWERNGGCNHFKCPTCNHHYCYVCLGSWDKHGVSWFECPWSDREVKSQQFSFYDTPISDDDRTVMKECVSREGDHAAKIQKLTDIRQNQTGALDRLMETHSNISQVLLMDLLSSLIQIHSVLQHTHIFLCLYQHELIRHRLTPLTTRLLYDINMCEYFISALDGSFINNDTEPASSTMKQVRSAYQLEETMKAIAKYAKIFATTLKLFIATEAQDAAIKMEQATATQMEEEKKKEEAAADSNNIHDYQQDNSRPTRSNNNHAVFNKKSHKNHLNAYRKRPNNTSGNDLSNELHRISAPAFFAALDRGSDRGPAGIASNLFQSQH